MTMSEMLFLLQAKFGNAEALLANNDDEPFNLESLMNGEAQANAEG